MIGNSLKYSVRLADYLPRKKLLGFLEWAIIGDILQRYEINCVLDVGASIGNYAQSLRRIGYKGLICSFEPVPDQFEILEHTMGQDQLWKGFNVALGSEDSTQTMHVTPESMAMSSFLRHKDANAKIDDREVVVRKLDALWSDAVKGLKHPRVLLKMDTQGYDLEVIAGAAQCLDHIIALQSELSVNPVYDEMPHYLKALQNYETLGFHLAGLFEIDRNKPLETVVEMNCFMVRPNSASTR